MKVSKNVMSVAAVAVAAFAGIGAAHADTTLSRAQVQSEYATAVKNGDTIEPRSGLRMNELYPSVYNVKPQASSVSRSQVEAERQAAVRNGDTIEPKSGLRLNQLYPSQYPNATAASNTATKSRDEVKREAIRSRNAGESAHFAQG